MKNLSRYEQVEKHGGSFQGKKELLKHLNKEDLSARLAIKAKCYCCMGYFADGKQDCKLTNCPLYPFMAYREGGVRKVKTMSAENRKKAGQRLKKGRISASG